MNIIFDLCIVKHNTNGKYSNKAKIKKNKRKRCS